MATVIETTDVSTAYQKLSSAYGVRRLTAVGGRPYLRVDEDRLGPAGLHHMIFDLDCSIDAPPIGAYFFGHLTAGMVRYHHDGDSWDSPLYGPGDTFLALQPDISWRGDHLGAHLEFASLGAALIAQAAAAAPGRRAQPVRFTGYQPATPGDARLWLKTFRYVRTVAGSTPVCEPLLAGTLRRLAGHRREPLRASQGQPLLPRPADQFFGRLLLSGRSGLSFFFATFSSVAVITAPLCRFPQGSAISAGHR